MPEQVEIAEKPAAASLATDLAWWQRPGLGDVVFKSLTACFAAGILLLGAVMALQLWHGSQANVKALGWSFLSSKDWDPVREIFGAVPFIYGTLVSSLIAFVIATPMGVGIALFLTELAPQAIRGTVAFVIEILAAIPSVVYGLWGMFVLAPFMREHVDPLLIRLVGPPFFAGPSTGLSLLTAGIILSIMILPTIMSISREVFESVPNAYRESALALGATSWETIVLAVVKPSQAGLLGAFMLGLGRAMGETMAVTMVIGNRPEVSLNLLAPSHSMASVIANEFTEATGEAHLSALAEIGLVLMVITLIINIAAQLLIWWNRRKVKG